MMRLLPLVLAALLAVSPALAVQPDELLADPALEARAREVSKDIRCLVCQNESIDDSNAELARDLRIIVRERIEAGDSNAEVKDFLVDRYGEFVLLNPRFTLGNAIIWLSGPLLLLVGGVVSFLWLRRRGMETGRTEAPLTEHERAELAALLDRR